MTRTRKTVVLLASLALAGLLASGVALAAAGDLDPSFGEGGKLLVEQNGGLNDVAVQPDDGKIVGAGSTPGDGRRRGGLYGKYFLVRSLPGGVLDGSFGGGDGIVTTDIRGSSDTRLNASDRAEAVLIQPDSKIVVAGAASGGTYETRYSHFALARYNPDGTLDETFGGGDGMVRTDVGRGSSSAADSLVRLPNGKLVAAGWARGKFALARYRADGRLDKRFGGGDGIVYTNGVLSASLTDLDRQPDDKLIASGGAAKGFALVRYHPGGRLDDTFGIDGRALTELRYAFLGSPVRQGDGKLVAAGVVYESEPDGSLGPRRAMLARFLGE